MFILKQLRRKKNLNQTEFAKAIGVSLRTIQLYERKNANIPMKNLQKIAHFFNTDIAQLYAQEVNENDASYHRQNIKSRKGHSILKLAPGKYLLSVPLVTGLDEAGYISGYENETWVSGLAKISFVVDQVSVSTYMAFEITNNSMKGGEWGGIPQGTIVLGKRWSKKEFIKKVKEGSDMYWILVGEHTVMCKKVTEYHKDSTSIGCHSLNNSPEFPDFEVPLDQIRQVFAIIKKQVD